MDRINFNKGWEFQLQNEQDAYTHFGLHKYSDATGAAARFYNHSNWLHVDLPHDWAVALPKDLLADNFAGARLKSNYHRFTTEQRTNAKEIFNIGWYRKSFFAKEEWQGKRLFLEFEGVYRDSMIWVNGVYLDRHFSGYTSFCIEITDHLRYGKENSVAVRVDSDQPEGWWYEGAGIYRNVFLHVTEPVYFKHNETVVKADVDGMVRASAILVNDTENEISTQAVWEIREKASGKVVATVQNEAQIPSYGEAQIRAELKIESPLLWHVDHPNLYVLSVKAVEQTEVTFGVRSFVFDANRGLLLNGKPVKVRGACVHQDFGGVGVALTDNLQYYKIARLKEMGVNAYRASHHAPSPVLLRACDELGMLVMDETRMFGTSPEALRQLESVVKRDRNHASVFIWSIGNEEFSIQNTEWSRDLAAKVVRIMEALDDTRTYTYGGNNGDNAIGANIAVPVRGVNYIRAGGGVIDKYHNEHPDQPIIGTEEASFVLSRGGAKTDLSAGLLDSSGQATMPWGSTPKGWIKYSEERDWFTGSFMWTGFDYRGEPNPLYYRANASSFGTFDLCGMEKPPFYYHKAWWTDEDVLKLTPHWNHLEGETVRVTVFTNCEQITLRVNGREVASAKVEKFDAPFFDIPFEEGVLSVEGTRNGKTLRDELRTAGAPHTLHTQTVLAPATADDIGIMEITALDADGKFCPTADDELVLTLDGGKIVGVGNGDPMDWDYEQKPREEEYRDLHYFETDYGTYSVAVEKQPNAHRHTAWRTDTRFYTELEPKKENFEDDFRLVIENSTKPFEKKEYTFVTHFDKAEHFEFVEFERLHGNATVYLNGVEIGNNQAGFLRFTYSGCDPRPYRFACKPIEGVNELKIVTVIRDQTEGVVSGYARLGRTVETPWRVRLHYGKARVFFRSGETPVVHVDFAKK